MSVMIINIGEQHREELQQMFRGAILTVGLANDEWEDLITDGLLHDRSRELDDFVRRCIGTFRRLEAHEAAGGVLYLGYPDGSLRQMTVDGATSTGEEIPKASHPLSPEMKRTVRRRSGR
jgi:hypothetical protein